jgi:hypothetical protein
MACALLQDKWKLPRQWCTVKEPMDNLHLIVAGVVATVPKLCC